MIRSRKRSRDVVGEESEVRPVRTGPLRLLMVETGTQQAYERVRKYFGEWLVMKGYSPTTPQEFDRRGEEYVTHVYDSGLPGYHACQLVGAMKLYHPLSKGKWIMTGDAAAGFRRVKPVKHWPPLPAEVVLAAAACLWKWDRREEAVGRLLGFHGYLRINDLCQLRKELVVLPGDAEEHIPASITMEDAKTGENQTVRLDSEFIISIVERQRNSHDEEKLFAKLTDTSFRKWVGKALHRLGLEEEGYVIHSLRHGGAARDYHHGFRTREEVKVRGRWESDKTFREYIDRGRKKLILDRLQGPKRQAILDLVKQHHGGLVDLPMVMARFEHL